MSFFGFDSSLPKDSNTSSRPKGIFEHTNPFDEVSKAQKLRAFHDVEDDAYVILPSAVE